MSGHEARRREREHVQERAVGLGQRDRDPPGGIVGLDAGDRLRGARVIGRGALDVAGEEGLAAPVALQRPLDCVREVGRLHRTAVAVLEPCAQGHRVRAAVG